MPAYAQAPIFGIRPKHCSRVISVIAAVAVVVSAVGCQEEVDEQIAERHAEVRGQYHAEMTARSATEWAFLHPNSERQQMARRQLLRLQQLGEPSPEADESDVSKAAGGVLDRWLDPTLFPDELTTRENR